MRQALFIAFAFFAFLQQDGAQAQSAAEKILAQRFAGTLEQAETGDVDAQVSVATAYRHGLGVEKNLSEAMRWYEAAAEQSSPEAMYELGTILHQSYPPEDTSEDARAAAAQSVEWFNRSARSGFAPAQGTLGLVYGFGDRVEIDRVRGRMWLHVAEANGHSVSSALSERLENALSAEERMLASNRAEVCISSDYTDCM